MGEAVVILTPYVRCEQIVQRCDLASPRQLRRDFQPFGVLVEHRIDDMDEGFIAIEQSMSSGEEVALEPTLALVLAQHFHYPPGLRQIFVARKRRGVPLAAGRFEDRFQSVRNGLVGTEDAEI